MGLYKGFTTAALTEKNFFSINLKQLAMNLCTAFLPGRRLLFFLPANCFFLSSIPQGIISDLFPGVVLPQPDYERFIQALNDNIKKMNLQPVPWFIGKIIQVIEKKK